MYAELAREGELDADYWHEYAVALSWSGEAHRWHCLPVGELPGGGMSWWRQGALSSEHLDEARRALAARVLVDWRVSTTQDRPPRTMLFNGHLINEPSGDEPETRDGLASARPAVRAAAALVRRGAAGEDARRAARGHRAHLVLRRWLRAARRVQRWARVPGAPGRRDGTHAGAGWYGFDVVRKLST